MDRHRVRFHTESRRSIAYVFTLDRHRVRFQTILYSASFVAVAVCDDGAATAYVRWLADDACGGWSGSEPIHDALTSMNGVLLSPSISTKPSAVHGLAGSCGAQMTILLREGLGAVSCHRVIVEDAAEQHEEQGGGKHPDSERKLLDAVEPLQTELPCSM